MCLTNRNGKGEGACCCCLYSVQPLRGFLHRGERSFSNTSTVPSLVKSGGRWRSASSLPVPLTWARSIHPYSRAVPSAQALNLLGLAQSCPGANLPCSKRSAGPATQQSPQRPPLILLCLCVSTVPCMEQSAAVGQAFGYSCDANRSNGEKF